MILNLLYWIFLLSLFIYDKYIRAQLLLPPINLDKYDAYGSLLAINEYLAIIAQNDQEYFTIITNPFTNESNKCTIEYSTTSQTRFVYNVAIGIKQNASQLIFSYVGENGQRDVFLTIIYLGLISTGCVEVVNQTVIDMTNLDMREHSLVAMDPYGKRAYAMGTQYIVYVEIETGVKWQLNIENLFNDQNNFRNLFFPKALVITEDYYIFTVGQKSTNLQFLPYLLVLNISSSSSSNITLLSAIKLSDFNFGPSSIDITHHSTMSISILDHIEHFIIGIPSQNMLIILFWKNTNIFNEPVILRKQLLCLIIIHLLYLLKHYPLYRGLHHKYRSVKYFNKYTVSIYSNRKFCFRCILYMIHQQTIIL